jgi:dolichol-phosphate mannosyltransferase
VLHIVLAVALPLSGDEAYYWDCSRHPDWATFDQPALVIWAMIPFRAVLGETALAVRAPAILASLAIGLFLLPLMRRLGAGTREAAWAYLLLHATPLFYVGSAYASTDVAMIAAMVGATWAAVAIAQGERRAWWGFGVSLGLGFLAKFPAVLVLAALVPVLARREGRAHLRTPTPYLAALLSLALTAPVFIWGARHDWINFAFQLAERHEEARLGVRNLLGFAVDSALLASPPLLLAIAMAWGRGARRREVALDVLLAVMAAPIVVFGLAALRESVSGHWSAPAVMLGCVVLVVVGGTGRGLLASGVIWGVLTTATGLGIVGAADRLASLAGGPGMHLAGRQATLFGSLVGNEEITAELQRRVRPGELVASESYSSLHLFAFQSGGKLETRLAKLTGGKHGLAALYWYHASELEGRDFLFVTEKDTMGERLVPLFSSVTREPDLVIERGGQPVRQVYFYRCHHLLKAEGVLTRLPASGS